MKADFAGKQGTIIKLFQQSTIDLTEAVGMPSIELWFHNFSSGILDYTRSIQVFKVLLLLTLPDQNFRLRRAVKPPIIFPSYLSPYVGIWCCVLYRFYHTNICSAIRVCDTPTPHSTELDVNKMAPTECTT